MKEQNVGNQANQAGMWIRKDNSVLQDVQYTPGKGSVRTTYLQDTIS